MSAIISKNNNTKGSGLTKGTPLDSANIVIVAKAGVGPIKMVDGTQQAATTLACDGTAGVAGNFLLGTNQSNSGSPAAITNVALTSNVLTITCANNFSVGYNIAFSQLATATFLNNQDVVVLTRSGTQFTAAFTHADYVSAADTGSATYTNASRASGLSLFPGHE